MEQKSLEVFSCMQWIKQRLLFTNPIKMVANETPLKLKLLTYRATVHGNAQMEN